MKNFAQTFLALVCVSAISLPAMAAPPTFKGKAKRRDTVRSSAAAASRTTESSVEGVRADLGSNFVDRVMVLPKGTLQGSTEMGLAHASTNGQGSTGFATSFGFEAGLGSRMQVGAAFSVPFSPKFTLGYFFVDGQYGITDFMNLRLNLGMNSSTSATGEAGNVVMNDDGTFSFEGGGSSVSRAFAGGIGAPIRLRLNERWALISGRTNIHAVIPNAGQGVDTDDIFTWQLASNAGFTSLGLPVGIETAFSETWSGRFRTGVRGLMGNASGTFIPLAFDTMVVPSRNWDLGATVALAGQVSSGAGYFDAQNFTLWAQTRF